MTWLDWYQTLPSHLRAELSRAIIGADDAMPVYWRRRAPGCSVKTYLSTLRGAAQRAALSSHTRRHEAAAGYQRAADIISLRLDNTVPAERAALLSDPEAADLAEGVPATTA